MAQKKYHIYNAEKFEGDQQLIAEIGNNYIALVLGSGSKIAGFEYFTSDDEHLEELLSYIKQQSQLLDTSYSETRVYYNLDEAVLVPVGYFNSSVAAEFTDTAFGPRLNTRINVESVNTQPSMVNVYRSDEYWQNVLPNYFRAITKRHVLSKLVESFSDADGLKVQFYHDQMIIIAKRNDHLQLARCFNFSTDEDAAYHLLNVCKQTAIEPLETTISVSGFINQDAKAIQLADKYFKKVVLESCSSSLVKEQPEKYPSHYFTPFFNLLQ